jgi:tetratricopeptide (TPR) repeat protein
MSTLSSAFHPDVAAFRTEEFSLKDDLDCLGRVRDARAPAAVVLCSARILEALALHAARRAGLAGKAVAGQDDPKVYFTLKSLHRDGHLGNEEYSLLDRLRDLGNEARHVRRKLGDADADQGYAIALRSVHWYFCDFQRGPRLLALTDHTTPLDRLLPAEAAGLLRMLHSAQLDGPGLLATLRLSDPHCPLLASPVLASVLAERLLDAGRRDEAQAVLTAALGRTPGDVRLRQLQGLLLSRSGRPAQACEWLERIGPTDWAADDETEGILAGAYKKRADAEPDARDGWLRRSHALYECAWRRSEGSNLYHGINVAALGLWLGRPDYPSAARSVLVELALREGRLSPRPLSLWDELTRAEAHLLLGEFDQARAAYRAAARGHPGEDGAIGVARTQAGKDLKALGREDLAGWMFDAAG